MDFKDRPDFMNKMIEIASLVGRVLTEEDITAFFKHLESYPLDVILKAMDRAYYSRDPEDYFNQRTMITEAEIRVAADDIIRSGIPTKIVGCEKCNHTGFILKDQKIGQPVCRPCECLKKIQEVRSKREYQK